MRISGSRTYLRPTPVPRMPPGLVDLMEGLSKEVLRNNPSNVYEFCASHMKKLLEIRDGPAPNQFFPLKIKNTPKDETQREKVSRDEKTLVSNNDDEKDILLPFEKDQKTIIVEPFFKNEVISPKLDSIMKIAEKSEENENSHIVKTMSSELQVTLRNDSIDSVQRCVHTTTENNMSQSTELPMNFKEESSNHVNETCNNNSKNVTKSDVLLASTIDKETKITDDNILNLLTNLKSVDVEKDILISPRNENDSMLKREIKEVGILNVELHDGIDNITKLKKVEPCDTSYELLIKSEETSKSNDMHKEFSKDNETKQDHKSSVVEEQKEGIINFESKPTKIKVNELPHIAPFIKEVSTILETREVPNEKSFFKTSISEENDTSLIHNISGNNFTNIEYNTVNSSNVTKNVSNNNSFDIEKNVDNKQWKEARNDSCDNSIMDRICIIKNKDDNILDINPNDLDNEDSTVKTDNDKLVVQNKIIHSDLYNSDNNTSFIQKTDKPIENNYNKERNITESSNMDLETAAITIQKVFRSFLFKSKGSSSEDTAIGENDSSFKETEKYIGPIGNKERRPLAITKIDSVLQTVNEEKSLSLSTDDSSTLSSAATIIQAHVRGFLVRNKMSTSKTLSTNSLKYSESQHAISSDTEDDKKNHRTILNIHIVPEAENRSISRDESVIISTDLSLDGSPPTSINLHPLGYDKSEPRKQLKREDAFQSVSPPSNNSAKLSEDIDSVRELEPSDNITMQSTIHENKNGSKEENSLIGTETILDDVVKEINIQEQQQETQKQMDNVTKMDSNEIDAENKLNDVKAKTDFLGAVTSNSQKVQQNIQRENDSEKIVSEKKVNDMEAIVGSDDLVAQSSSTQKQQQDIQRQTECVTKLGSDEKDVITPFSEKEDQNLSVPNNPSNLIHSGEFHDVVLPTKVIRTDTTVVRGE